MTPDQNNRKAFKQADLLRRVEALLIAGEIEEVDHGSTPPSARVRSGDLLTDWLPLPADIGRNYKRWQPFRIGTQCLVAAPSGDLTNGWIVSVFFSDSTPAPEQDEGVDVVIFNDGTELKKTAVSLSIKTPCPVQVETQGNASIKAAGTVSFLGGGESSAAPVVTTACVCAFTKAPHPEGSQTVKASK